MNDIETLWAEIRGMSFPSNVSRDRINDISPAKVSASATDCIGAFLAGGTLDSAKKQVLNQCLSDMQALNPALVGEAQVYFGKLYRLCDLVRAQV